MESAVEANYHIVGCTDPDAKKEYRQKVFARVPWNSTAIWFLCVFCHRRHTWVIDQKLRDWKDKS